jgi:CRISPR system Cascade subunit CasA
LPDKIEEWRRACATARRDWQTLVFTLRRGAIPVVAGLVVAGAVGGCAHYHAAPLAPQQSSDEFAARRLTALEPPRDWDRGLLLAVALRQNPQLAVARAEVDAALSRQITAAQAPDPDLTLQSEYARHDAHPWLYGVSVNWLLRSPERRRLDVEIAGADTRNARLQLMDQAWAVRSALAAALCDWEGGRRRSSVLDRLAGAEDRLLAVEVQRVKTGEDAQSELLIVQQARIQIEQQQAESRQAVEAAQAAAAKALGLPPQALDGVIFAWPEWGEPPPIDEELRRETREQALLSRADLGQAIGEYAAAEAKLHLSIARQYPEFTLSPGYYWDHGIAKFPFDVGFTVPFSGNRGEIAEARTGRELAGRRMLALQAAIYGEIAGAERAEHIARASTEAAERQWQAARQQQQQAELEVRVGASDAQHELAADILALRAELEVLQMHAQWQSSRNTLEDALHTPLSGPELELAKSMATMASGSGS